MHGWSYSWFSGWQDQFCIHYKSVEYGKGWSFSEMWLSVCDIRWGSRGRGNDLAIVIWEILVGSRDVTPKITKCETLFMKSDYRDEMELFLVNQLPATWQYPYVNCALLVWQLPALWRGQVRHHIFSRNVTVLLYGIVTDPWKHVRVSLWPILYQTESRQFYFEFLSHPFLFPRN